MSSNQSFIPNLGLDSHEVLREIAFVPENKLETLELVKYDHIDHCSLKQEKLHDDEEQVSAWLQKVFCHSIHGLFFCFEPLT